MDRRFVQESLKHCSWIKISLNAGTAETYSKVHRVKEAEFHKVIENIKYALWYKKEHGLTCDIGVQSVMLPENAHEMETLAALCKNLGVDYFVVKQFNPSSMMLNKQYDNVNYKNYMGIADRVNALASENFDVVFRHNVMKDNGYDKCMSVPFIWGYIATSGKFLACSAHFLEERFNLGNINDQDFKTIWNGDKRKALFEEKIDISSCRKNCRMDSCNRFLLSVKDDTIPHVNFI
jgi:MoaA/NifB/PqqE/SkfB family radical SAM enzyme